MEKNICVLIVEDEAIIAQVLKMELEFSGYDVCCFVASGEEAIVKAKEDNPDVILMDIHLSGKLDGIEAAEIIQKFKNIPVILCTGYDRADIVERAKKINPAAYLRKPLVATEIQRTIESIFN